MRLTTVGTGTAAPHASRSAAAHLLQAGNVSLLLDCGAGAVHRMASFGIAWSDITHVAITHFHPDHVADLVMLLMGWRWGQLPARTAPVTIYGPVGLGVYMEKLADLYGAWLLAPGFPCTIRELVADESVHLSDDVRLEARPVPHTVESVAYSVRQHASHFVYTGDTGYDEAVADWAAGCDLLLAECSLPDSMAIREHLTPRQAGGMAARAAAAQLVLTHFYPPVELVDITSEVAELYTGPVTLATDGWFIDF
ncbi:MAG: ribonuclease Z [Gemmatimonadaceae bacterium]|nr:ribonuclease Z [Gemmatimonadaceae bacterium]